MLYPGGMYKYHPKHLTASLTLLKSTNITNFQLCTILHPPKPKGTTHHIALMLESANNNDLL